MTFRVCEFNTTDSKVFADRKTVERLTSMQRDSIMTVCENDTAIIYGDGGNLGEVLWTTTGDGTFCCCCPDSLVVHYIPGPGDIAEGCITMVLIGHPIEPCTIIAVDQMELCFEPLPEVYAGSDGVVCEDGTFCMTEATATNATTVEWTTPGDGTFDDAGNLNTCYHPGAGDVANGSVELILHGNPNYFYR